MKHLFTIAAAGALISAPASAATLAYDFAHEFDLSDPNDIQYALDLREPIPLFDSALGTLVSANLTANITYSFSFDWDATTATRGLIHIFGGYQTLIYQDPTLQPVANTGAISFDIPSARAGTAGNWSDVVVYDRVDTLVDPLQLARLTGEGTYDQLLFSTLRMWVASDLADGTGAASTRIGAAAVMNYRLSFEYVPAGVPEPATWAAMLSGFALVGAVLRRRRGLVFPLPRKTSPPVTPRARRSPPPARSIAAHRARTPPPPRPASR